MMEEEISILLRSTNCLKKTIANGCGYVANSWLVFFCCILRSYLRRIGRFLYNYVVRLRRRIYHSTSPRLCSSFSSLTRTRRVLCVIFCLYNKEFVKERMKIKLISLATCIDPLSPVVFPS